MSIFVTSDHHFGSYKLITPFQVFSKEQEEELIDKWNSVVKPNDQVIYNGDFCDGNLTELCEYVKRLNGDIILVKGNHDVLPNNVYEAVFKNVLDELTLGDIVIHHCPRDLKSGFEIYGHLHRSSNESLERPNSFCSCVQWHDGYPVKLVDIIR